jgi:hypothetical protein
MIIPKEEKLNVKKAVFYAVLFTHSILAVFNIVHDFIVIWIILVSLLIVDYKALAKVDYGLLFTFCAFFVFAGNMSRIPFINDALSFLLSKNTMIVSALSCQFISNVPSAILLSNFTDNYSELLLGVNIGGAGTLIASLASLITFREYTKRNPGKTGYYMLLFTGFNVAFLALLIAFVLIF